jgi:tetratricopeptide (TPR) repeat protein
MNANALNSLGYIMAEEEIDLQEALKYCREAVRIKPENPSYLDSLGWACYRLGRYEEALAYLKKAHSNSGGHKTIASHLREVMQKLPKH